MILSFPFFFILIWVLVPAYHLSSTKLNRILILLFATAAVFISQLLWVDLILLLSISVFAYYAAKAFKPSRLFLWISVFIVGLPFLIFKYLGLKTGEYSMPLGLSYATLAIIAYVIDINKGRNTPITSLPSFLSSSLFFAALPSGPILSVVEIEKQIEKPAVWNRRNLMLGILLIMNGLFKKNIADLLTALSVKSAFDPLLSTVLDGWISFFALGAQFYADFSGYTDMAIGFALLFGIRLPDNFNLPFLSTDMSDFWTRWHMSLSQWARTYVFYPTMAQLMDFLNRKQEFVTVAMSIFATMTFIGFWHGFSLVFLAWAFYNTVLILLTPRLASFISTVVPGAKFILIPLNFIFIGVGFLFFKFEEGSMVLSFVTSLFYQSTALIVTPYKLLTLGFVVLTVLIPHGIDAFIRRYEERCLRLPVWLIFILITSIFCLSFGRPTQPFIYSRY